MKDESDSPNVSNSSGGQAPRWTPSELLKLPASRRAEILKAAAALAEADYAGDPSLIAFDAFGKDDLYVESASDEAQ